ncbi:protein involved in gliding motility GldB [Pricia antarctica]|uniref:Protein involved in gliding motility GldB n=2 Tax=Pricia antarctica TaxID=641691 RepID=A0A1G7GNP5_9FLAO|nr:protein involved in gliding motility GldB [Pricia antarctica]
MYRELLYNAKRIFIILIISVCYISCSDSDKVEKEIDTIEVDLDVARFDREFAKAKPLDIPVLKKAYPYLFPAQYTDSVWVAKLQDSLQVELLSEVGATFSDFSEERDDLILLFKHIKYYFPDYVLPKVVTVTSDVRYNSRIIMTDSLLLIGLDNYLGPEHKFYENFPKYIAAGLDKQYLVSDVANAFAKQVVPKPKDRSFLAQMVYYGKELVAKDKLVPFITDAQKINYSEEQLAWAEANEEQIWRNFIESEYLYSTDTKLAQRFLDPAPFSKFGLELDNASPGRVGRFIGWQIVRAFMEKNGMTLQQMLPVSAEEIFKKSNYKPKK